MMQCSKYSTWGKGLKQLKGYTKISGSLAATKYGVKLHLIFTMYVISISMETIMLLSYGVGSKFATKDCYNPHPNSPHCLLNSYGTYLKLERNDKLLARKKKEGRRNGVKDGVWYVVSRNVSTRSFITKIKVHPLMVV